MFVLFISSKQKTLLLAFINQQFITLTRVIPVLFSSLQKKM